MNILITGANGQLGNEMRVLSKENGQHAYFFTDVQELDICDEQSVHGFVKEKRRPSGNMSWKMMFNMS